MELRQAGKELAGVAVGCAVARGLLVLKVDDPKKALRLLQNATTKS